MSDSKRDSVRTPPPSEVLLDRLLDAMLATAGQNGWTRAALDAAARAVGLSPGEVELAAPGGVSDVLRAFGQRMVKALEAELSSTDLAGLKVREKVRAGVLAYLCVLTPHKEAMKRATVSPFGAVSGPGSLWQAADAIWRALGDVSTDGNWYSKRLILSGVIGSTLVVWLDADDMSTVETFLDHRIENVMTFERAKADVRKTVDRLVASVDEFFSSVSGGARRP